MNSSSGFGQGKTVSVIVQTHIAIQSGAEIGAQRLTAGCRDIRGVQRAVFGFRHTGYANPYRPFTPNRWSASSTSSHTASKRRYSWYGAWEPVFPTAAAALSQIRLTQSLFRQCQTRNTSPLLVLYSAITGRSILAQGQCCSPAAPDTSSPVSLTTTL